MLPLPFLTRAPNHLVFRLSQLRNTSFTSSPLSPNIINLFAQGILSSVPAGLAPSSLTPIPYFYYANFTDLIPSFPSLLSLYWCSISHFHGSISPKVIFLLHLNNTRRRLLRITAVHHPSSCILWLHILRRRRRLINRHVTLIIRVLWLKLLGLHNWRGSLHNGSSRLLPFALPGTP